MLIADHPCEASAKGDLHRLAGASEALTSWFGAGRTDTASWLSLKYWRHLAGYILTRRPHLARA